MLQNGVKMLEKQSKLQCFGKYTYKREVVVATPC